MIPVYCLERVSRPQQREGEPKQSEAVSTELRRQSSYLGEAKTGQSTRGEKAACRGEGCAARDHGSGGDASWVFSYVLLRTCMWGLRKNHGKGADERNLRAYTASGTALSPSAERRNLDISGKSGRRICSDRKAASACLEMGVREEEVCITKCVRKLLKVISVFTIHTHVLKLDKLYILKVCKLWYAIIPW